VAELTAAAPGVVAVLSSPEGCDAAIASVGGASACRTSAREALLVGAADLDAVETAAKRVDAHVVVEDVTDGWCAFAIVGGDAVDVVMRVSELRLPDRGFAQGEVAGVAAKVLAEPGRIVVLVASAVADHVERRIREDAAELLA
jgi:hypothetical protein